MSDAFVQGGLELDSVGWLTRMVIAAVPEANAVVFDRELRIVLAEGKGYARHGTMPEALIGRLLADVLPAASWRQLRDRYHAALGGARQSFEYESTDGLGHYWLHLSPVEDARGAIVGAVVVSQDVTQRTEREDAHRKEVEAATVAFLDAPIGMAVVGLDGRFLRVNPALCRMLGHSDEELLGADYRDFQHPDERDDSGAALTALRSGRMTSQSERRYVRADGSEAWGQVSTTLLRGGRDRPDVLFAQVQDVTERHRTEQQLRRRLSQQSAVAELGRRALAGASREALVEAATDTLVETLEVEVTSFLELAPSRDELLLRAGRGWRAGELGRRRVPMTLSSSAGFALTTRQPVVSDDLRAEDRFEAPVLLEYGILSSVSVLVGQPDCLIGVLGAHARVTNAFSGDDAHFVEAIANVLAETIERRRAEEQVYHQAGHDALTGLPNRTAFLAGLEDALSAAPSSAERIGVFLLDLDDFQTVNDSLGQSAGDELLREVGNRLGEEVRTSDVMARFGGDEFAVLSPSLPDASTATEVAERMCGAFARPFEIGAERHYLQASVGVVVGGCATEAHVLVRDAGAALDRAKARGRGGWELHDEPCGPRRVDRLRLRGELHRALEQGELRVAYQPFYSLDQRRPVGAEALVRWAHPERGLLTPGEFLPVADESDLIVELGEWVLRETCVQGARWREQLDPHVPFLLTVNVAARQFIAATLSGAVRDALDRAGLPADCLGLEVSEGAIGESPDEVIASLEALKGVGARILLDDFGTGFSSLWRLKRLPIDVVKIDRCFVDQLAEPGSQDPAIVKAILGMTSAMGMEVIAEGVETGAQLDSLRALGCRTAQGFFLGRPLPPDEFGRMVTGEG